MFKFIVGLFLCFTSFLGFAQGKDPVSWKVESVKIDPLTYKVNIQATIKSPYHIYPIKSSGGGLGMPTAISFGDNPQIDLVGSIEEKALAAAEGKRVSYFAEGAIFSQTVRLKADEPQTLTITVKYMACNDRMCLPPAKKTLTVVVNGDQIAAEVDNSNKETAVEVVVDKPYQHFELPDTAGKLVSSKGIVENSKYTFIDFWASWCVPCRAQGRDLLPLYKKYQGKGFQVIAVSLDTNADRWNKAIVADGYTWTNLSDLKGFDSPLAKYYNITAIPHNFLIDKHGNIIAKDLHGQELENKLIELFGK